jgi:hypothetical protein
MVRKQFGLDVKFVDLCFIEKQYAANDVKPHIGGIISGTIKAFP